VPKNAAGASALSESMIRQSADRFAEKDHALKELTGQDRCNLNRSCPSTSAWVKRVPNWIAGAGPEASRGRQVRPGYEVTPQLLS
jgi:hypothetical protein